MKTLKQKLVDRDKVCGSHVLMNDFISSDIVSSLDYDFIWVDTEHSCIDNAALLNHIAIIKNKGKSVLVRVHQDDFNHTKHVLEMGPDGIIFPMINTREEAEKAIKSTYYPPRGNRGCGPLRACCWGGESLTDYKKREDYIIRCVQIETKQAVENLEDILTVDGIDCFIFGPCDLSASIGKFSEVFSDENLYWIKRATEILKKAGKSIGVSYGGTSDGETLKRWNDLGMNLISSGSDYEAIRSAGELQLELLKKAQGRN